MADYSKIIADMNAEDAGANLNGAMGVAPEKAVRAFRTAPQTGVAPSLGMIDDGGLEVLASMQRDGDILNRSPPVRSFAAQSPAHVAATRDDWGSLAALGEKFNEWNTIATKDFFAPGEAAFQSLVVNLKELYNAGSKPEEPSSLLELLPGFTPKDKAFGAVLADVMGLTFSPVTGLANVAARPVSAIPLPAFSRETGELLSQEERQAGVTNALMLSLSGLGAGRALPARPVAPRAAGAPALPPPTPRLPSPTRPGETPVRRAVAEMDAEILRRGQEAVAGTATQTRLPALLENFVNQHTAGRAMTVWVPPEDLAALWAKNETAFQRLAPQVSEGLATGRDVSIPIGTYLTETAGQPFAEELNAVARLRENGVSVEEAKGLKGEEGNVVPPPVERDVALPDDIGAEPGPNFRELAASADVAVEEIFAEQMLTSLFTDAKALKMNKGQFDRYDAMLSEAKAAASERVLERTYTQIRRERTPEWKDRVERMRFAVEEEVVQNRAIVARQALQYSEGPRGEPLEGLKFNREAVAEAFGASTAENLPRSMFSASGLDPDDVAPLLGYNSGQELLSDLLDLEAQRVVGGFGSSREHLKGMIDAEATARARAALGYDISPEGIRAAAREEAVLPQVEDFLDAQLRDLAEEVGLPFDKEAVRVEAKRQFDAMLVGDAIRVRTFERGMWQTGNKTQIALEKGNWVKAFQSRQQQLLNFYQLEMSHFLAKKLGVAERKFTKLGKRKAIRGLAQPYLNQLHSYLPRLGISVRRDLSELAEALDGVGVEEFVAGVIAENPAFPEVPSAAAPLRELSVTDFWSVREFVYAMDKYGREVQTLKLAEGRAEFEEMVERFLVAVPPGGTERAPTMGNHRSFAERMGARLRGYDAAHRKIADIGEFFDRGNPQGVMAQVIEYPIEAASDLDGKLRREAYAPVDAAFWKIPVNIRRHYSSILPDHPFFAPDGRKMELRRGDVPAIALYVGQESSLRKLAEGYGTTEAEVLAFLDAHIFKEEVEFVQKVWDGFEEISPEVSRVLRAMTGAGLVKEPSRTWVTPFGTMRGGYFPIRYNRELDRSAAERETRRAIQIGADQVNQFFAQVVPGKGFAEKRTNYVGPLLIRLTDVADAFDAHIKYAAFAQPVNSIRRFINDARVRSAITNRMGEEYYDQFNPWLDSVVLDYIISDKGVRALESIAHQLRINTTMATLAFSYTTMVSQAAGLASSVGVIGPGPLARGMADFGRIALGGKIQSEIFDKSEFMAQRFGQVEPNMVAAINATQGLSYSAGRVAQSYKTLQRAGLALIGWVEFATVSAPTWLGAFSKARGELAMSEGDAIRYADRIVRKSQGSGRRVDLAAVQRGSGFQRWFYMFNTWFNTSYQRMIEAGRAVGEGDYGKAFGLFFTVLILSPLIGALITGHGPEDNDPVTIAEWAGQSVFFNLLRPMIGVGNVGSVAERNIKAEGGEWIVRPVRQWDFATDPLTGLGQKVFRLLEMVGKATQGEEVNRPVQTVAQGIGTPLGIPGANQLGRTGEYLWELYNRDQQPEEAIDIAKGVALGPQKDQAFSGRSGR